MFLMYSFTWAIQFSRHLWWGYIWEMAKYMICKVHKGLVIMYNAGSRLRMVPIRIVIWQGVHLGVCYTARNAVNVILSRRCWFMFHSHSDLLYWCALTSDTRLPWWNVTCIYIWFIHLHPMHTGTGADLRDGMSCFCNSSRWIIFSSCSNCQSIYMSFCS